MSCAPGDGGVELALSVGSFDNVVVHSLRNLWKTSDKATCSLVLIDASKTRRRGTVSVELGSLPPAHCNVSRVHCNLLQAWPLRKDSSNGPLLLLLKACSSSVIKRCHVGKSFLVMTVMPRPSLPPPPFQKKHTVHSLMTIESKSQTSLPCTTPRIPKPTENKPMPTFEKSNENKLNENKDLLNP